MDDTPAMAVQAWKTIGRGPHVSVAGFALDDAGNFPLIFRGPNVRSARNAWSIPSGLHENGLTLAQQLVAELKEELNLEANPATAQFVGLYENIARADQYHWVNTVWVIRVKTLDTLINSEPDKHPEVKVCNIETFNPHDFIWTPHLGEFIREYLWKVQEICHETKPDSFAGGWGLARGSDVPGQD